MEATVKPTTAIPSLTPDLDNDLPAVAQERFVDLRD
jgi:hypothetical protein